MATAAAKSPARSRYSRIWAGAKAAGLTRDEIHDLIGRDYQKDSLTELTDLQVEQFGTMLWNMSNGRQTLPTKKKRTDEGGRKDNIGQRRKIFVLAKLIGWNEESINKFCQKEYGVSRHEWLPPQKCSNMIDAMNAIAKREGKLK